VVRPRKAIVTSGLLQLTCTALTRPSVQAIRNLTQPVLKSGIIGVE
jgi:hypothetical protein